MSLQVINFCIEKLSLILIAAKYDEEIEKDIIKALGLLIKVKKRIKS